MRSTEARIGEIIADRYRLTGLMSAGRFGDFWNAVQLSDGAEVALKLLKAELFTDEEAVARFERETRLLVNWKHPNLLKVLDHGRIEGGVPWIATELKRGRPLYDEIATQTVSVEIVRHIAAQIARVLAGAHARGIVHRSVHPDAILLCEERGDPYRVKVLDFGVAHIPGAEGEEQLTRVGQKLGQAEYWAPEYIEEGVLDARSDLYGLGILTFELLTGQPPFVGNARKVMLKHLQDPPVPPSHLSMKEIPPWLDALVLQLLEKDPDKRPRNAMAVADVFTKGG